MAARKKKSPKFAPEVPNGLFTPASGFVVIVPAKKKSIECTDILDACKIQERFDPWLSYVLRQPDGVLLKIRNGSSDQLARLARKHGGHAR